MLGTEADQGKGSLFLTLVQKGYVHMALVKKKRTKVRKNCLHYASFSLQTRRYIQKLLQKGETAQTDMSCNKLLVPLKAGS